MASWDIRLCRTEDELRAVQRLRYSVYVEEMGRPQPHADHEGRRITDELDATGDVLAVDVDGEIVGTLRLNRVAEGIGRYDALYGLMGLPVGEARRTVIVTVLMLRPEHRRSGSMGAMFRAVYALARTRGVDTCWIDCNEPLVPMFEGWGFRSVRPVAHPLYGTVRLMRLDLLDRAHLAATRSPFVSVLDDPTPHLPRNAIMSSLDRLKADFAVVIDRFHRNPACARLRSGDFTVREYASLMAAVALQARENPQIQAYATAFFRGHQREMVKLFYKHAVSEIGHDQLAADDVATLGFDTDGLFEQQPLPSTVALTAYAYYTIDHHDPVGYLGYLFFLEFLPTSLGAEYMAALDRAGVPAEARTFLHDHATIDVGHNKLMERYVEELVVDEASYEAVRYAMEVTGALYARMVEEAFERADELGRARPLSPWELTRRPGVREGDRAEA